MALWLIDSDGNRYDFLKANITTGFEISTRRRLIDLAFGHGSRDVGDQKLDSRDFRIRTAITGETGGFLRMLYDCGDNNPLTDWATITNDALALVEDTTYVKQGIKSMKCGVDADKDVADMAWWGYSGSALNLTNSQHDWAYLWVYFATLDYLHPSTAAFVFYIGNDISNRIGFSSLKSELSVGWNLVKCDFDNPDLTDGSVDWTAIDYIYIGVYESVGNTTDFDFYVDDIKIWREGYQAELDDLMRWIGKQDLTFYKTSGRYLNVESMDLRSHSYVIGDAKCIAEVNLVSPDPFWYKATETTETNWTVTSSPDTRDYFNEGNIEVCPVIEITAAADLSAGIELMNQSDENALFTYIDNMFTSGKKLTVDCHNGTVDLDGTNTLRFFEGQFLRLLPQMNTFQYTGGNCTIVFKHRDRWI